MLLISDLMLALEGKIKGIPEVVIDMGDDGVNAISHFIERDPDSSWLPEVISDMPSPGILIVYDGTELGFRGGFTQWRHNFSIMLKTPGDAENGYYQLLAHIVNGASTYAPVGQQPSGLSLLNDEIDPRCDPMELAAMMRENDAAKKRHYYRLPFSLQEKGGSGF